MPFGEEIGRNAARATYDLLTLHITPGSLILAVVAIVTYPRWIEKIDGNGTIRKNFSIRLCDDPVDDKKWKDRVLIVFFGIIAIGFWVYAHQNY